MPHRTKHAQKGFTLPEMLLVVAITIVLLAVSVVAIVTYMRHLQITRLDNSAREIFLAAQNRAILLSGGQRLESYVVHTGSGNEIPNVEVIPGAEGTPQITVYYIHSSDLHIAELLPEGTIDPTLWEGDFWIIYEPKSGSVVDVFFSEEELPVDAAGDFPAFYATWRTAGRAARMDAEPMIGYYGGESAESGSTISLRTPVINIYNENTLRLEITYWVPRTLAMMEEGEHIALDVTLEYQGQSLLLDLGWAEKTSSPEVSYFVYTYTWTLDSLESGKQFQDLPFPSRSSLTYGDDFTVVAEVLYNGTALTVNGAVKRATDNSLFAKDSGEETAYISCLRHLQNLDTAFSGVEGKTAAEQTGDIQGVEAYSFQPIENEELARYDGGAFSIYDLDIAAGTGEPAGMFGAFSGVSGTPKTLENIRLVNTTVTAGTAPAGGLVGNGAHLELENCQVYWENRSNAANNLRDVLGDSEDLWYQITGSGPAGGLAGKLKNSYIYDCSASSLVKSDGPVGGLVGQGSGLDIKRSYGASYLAGPAAAGLVGALSGSGNLISGSYAVGFIDSGTTAARAAGLCLGEGTVHVDASYSAMLFTAKKDGSTLTNYPLCETGTYAETTHYLDSQLFGFGTQDQDHALTYSQLIDPAGWGELFGDGVFAQKTTAQTHPYNLQTTLSLSTFIYPGSKVLDHWGDWGAQFQNGSLVYYEIYQDGSCGFSSDSLSYLSENKLPVLDGYAVAYKGSPFTSGIDVALSVTYETAANTQDTISKSYQEQEMYKALGVQDAAGEKADYYLLPLPETVVDSPYSADHFYQKITVRNEAQNTQSSYYYSPHFATTVIPYDDKLTEEDLHDLAQQLRVEVRTPRHLYNLSRFENYYSSDNQYRFLQQLDLDYNVYTGAAGWSQTPIGLDAGSPFRCSYYGNYYSISGVVPTSVDGEGALYPYVGLFGYSTGVLQDMVYEMEEGDVLSVTCSGSAQILYAGALAGYNGGTVSNCAAFGVQLQANGYQYSTIYLGGLVGENRGSVRSSAVEGAAISAEASMSHAYAGGFVGENTAGGIIDQCYAVGKVSVTQARYGTVYACGFAGRSSATLSRSYAAVHLLTDGDAQRYGFCPDSSTDCVYLNNGNFTYRGENYAALYQDGGAVPVTWEALTGQNDADLAEQAAAVAALGMSGDTAADSSAEAYPYPGTVTVKDGSYIHYGQWPQRMDLGAMGVYYWEELTIGNTKSYHISAISRTSAGQVMKSDTLSVAHGDGGVVTGYGYGYFSKTSGEGAGISTTLTSTDIGYNSNGTFTPQPSLENQTANQKLSELMGGQYTFHSYDTWQADKQQGLFVKGSVQSSRNRPPYGIWTLTRGGETLTVYLNPFFADAMSYVSGGWSNLNVPTALPGLQDNPYGVRSIDQLQFINWNSTNQNTKTVLTKDNRTTFPYLSYGDKTTMTNRPFYWAQSHDLTGSSKTYTPIAEFYDQQGGNLGSLSGWFGGTYDGQDYLIANVNIQGQKSSCAGLFGVVFNGVLQNVVLYSEDGKGFVKSYNNEAGRTASTWYAIGGLAGLAASTKDSAIKNCAVAGYTITDSHTGGGGWGGTGLGGLVGISNMKLFGCSAVTNIVLSSKDNDNVRVGGLVGTSQGSISSCYSGGSIQVQNAVVASNRGIYIGGISGGIYMKPLEVGGTKIGQSGGARLTNTIENCYTYVELPDQDSKKPSDIWDNGQHFYGGGITALYAIGGNGDLRDFEGSGVGQNTSDRGKTTYTNNYYLKSVVMRNNPDGIQTQGTQGLIMAETDMVTGNTNVIAMSYQDMANPDSADGLLAKLKGAGFSTVTTTSSSGNPLSGRYSFGCDSSLLGRDYPFPTILTQSSGLVISGRANVHYGDWPLAGIRREQGALPVNLDLFADYQEGKGAVHTETLYLEGVEKNGSWRVDENAEGYDADIASAALSASRGETNTLTITAKKAGSTVVTVIYTDPDGVPYSLNIEVTVTAELRLAAVAQTPVLVLTDETVKTALELRDRDGEQLAVPITLKNLTVEYDPDYFTEAPTVQEEDLTLTAVSSTEAGNTQLTVGYDFTYLGNDYHATSSLALRLVTPEITLASVEFLFEPEVSPETQTATYTGEGFALKVDGQEVEIPQGVQITDFVEVDETQKSIIWVEWDQEPDQQMQGGSLTIEAYRQTVYPVTAMVRVQFRFDYAGSTHTLWRDVTVELLDKPKEEDTGSGSSGGTEEDQP